ncbi:MAG: ERCC4 domain-containing protein, partial [Patescibacteria group bacterium]
MAENGVSIEQQPLTLGDYEIRGIQTAKVSIVPRHYPEESPQRANYVEDVLEEWFPPDLLVERASTDLIAKIKSRLLNEQLYRLSTTYHSSVLIIEGNLRTLCIRQKMNYFN